LGWSGGIGLGPETVLLFEWANLAFKKKCSNCDTWIATVLRKIAAGCTMVLLNLCIDLVQCYSLC
jgi:hypothetical protein